MRIAAVMKHDLHDPRLRFGQSYEKEKGVPLDPDVLSKVEFEYKRLMIICGGSGNTSIGVGPAELVDDFWHEHILFTKQYMEFCQEHFGEYIHHQPCGKGLKSMTSEMEGPEAYHDFLCMYRETFGEEAPVEFWPRISTHSNKCGTKCLGCRCQGK